MSQVTSTFGKTGLHVHTNPKDHEAVRAFLHRFANRWTLLRAIQGICAFVVTITLLSTLVVFADGMRWLSDPIRWSISCGVYLTALMVAWRFGLKAFWESTDSISVAQSIEQASPRFRESLLSSVELRGMDGSIKSGSHAFVSAIERDVAKEVRRIDLEDLLPWTTIVRGLTICMMLLMVTLMICAVPGLKYSQRLARALLPFVSLSRPSNVRIVILEPSPASLAVPSEQTLRFLIEVEGGHVDSATLEFADSLEQPSQSHRETDMLLESEQPKRFSVVSSVGSATTRYRVRAGDGETAWHQLETLARPKAMMFTTQVNLPGYVPKDIAAQFYQRTDSNLRGDFRVLVGSRVRLEVDTNQPLKLGSLELESLSTGRKTSIPLALEKPTGDRQIAAGATSSYTADFEVPENAKYQVRLQAATEYQGNPLENTFSPVYRIDTLEDAAAALTWSVSDSTVWRKPPDSKEIFVVAPNELIGLAINCQDNLPVESLDFEWSLNRGAWQLAKSKVPVHEQTLGERPATLPAIKAFEGAAKWDWDLTDYKLEGGDTLQCRAKGIDLKGGVSYSSVVTFSVSANGYDRDRYDSLERMSELVAPLKEFAETMAAKREGVRTAIGVLKNPASSVEQRSQATRELGDVAKLGILKAQSIRSQAEPIVRDLKRCIDQSDVEMAMRNVSRIEKEYLHYIAHSHQSPNLSLTATEIASKSDWFQSERETRLNRMQQCFDLSCDQSNRTLELYRQFVGLELQTAITKDLTGLMNHQQTLLDRKPPVSLETMIRSQKLSEQYCNAALKLAKDFGPSVNQDLRDGLANLSRWGNDTMLEIKDLCEADLGLEVSEKARDTHRDQLRARIERSANELRNQRWAYNLGGNLIWNIHNARRELWNSSGSLRTRFHESLDRIRKRNEMVRDNLTSNTPERSPELGFRIASLETEVVSVHFTALLQMLDRRDLQQRRGVNNPVFTSDMGLAHRAWTKVLEDWIQNPADHANQTKNLEEVAKAFYILEAAHEAMEAKLVLQALRSKEQYDWKAMEGQLSHATQWDSIAQRVEFASQWMKEAGIEQSLAEKFNALRYGELANRIAQKLHPRRDPHNQNWTSASDDMQRLLTKWNEHDNELKPILDAARATLSNFAPSISELAEKAAQATQNLRSKTEQIQKESQETKADSTEPAATAFDPLKSAADLMKSQMESELKLQQLQDALIEQASRQDLLQNEQLQAARDSDNALRLLDAVSIPMKEAMLEVAESINAQKTPSAETKGEMQSKLSEAVQRESQTVAALEAVAKHFAKLESAMDQGQANTPESSLAKAPDANASLEQNASSESLQRQADSVTRELALDPQFPSIRDSNQDYAKAKDLAEQAQRDPRTLLENLERELKANPLMQSELSEIAKASAESVANSLRNASKEEKQLALQVENADAKLVAEKQLQIDRAQAITEQVERFTARSLEKAAQAVNATGKHEQAQALNQAAKSLRKRSSALQQLNENTPRQQFQLDTQALADEVTKANQELAKVQSEIEPMVGLDIHKGEQLRVNTKEAMRNVQIQNRNDMLVQGNESVNRANQKVQEAKRRVQQLVQPLSDARKQTEAAKKRWEEQKSNPDALKHLQNTAVQEEQFLEKSRSASDRTKQAEELLQQSEQRKRALEEAERADLDKPDPRAALAMDQASQSRKQLDSLQEQLDALNQSARSLPEPKSQASPLANLETSQKKLKENVRELATDIDQAARHEQRLENAEGANSLKESAKAIRQLSEGQLQQAQQELGQATEAASTAESDQAKSLAKDQEMKNSFDRPGTQGSVNSLNQASEELLGNAKQLENASSSKDQSKPATGSRDSDDNKSASSKNSTSPKPSNDEGSEVGESSSHANSDVVPMTDQQKARMLDQLDRQVNSKQGDSNRSLQDAIRQSADQLSNAMNQARLDQQASSMQNKSNSPNKPSRNGMKVQRGQSDTAGEDRANRAAVGVLPNRTLELNRDWGQLREQRAEDVIEGNRDEFDPEFSDAIQAYYRAVGKP